MPQNEQNNVEQSPGANENIPPGAIANAVPTIEDIRNMMDHLSRNDNPVTINNWITYDLLSWTASFPLENLDSGSENTEDDIFLEEEWEQDDDEEDIPNDIHEELSTDPSTGRVEDVSVLSVVRDRNRIIQRIINAGQSDYYTSLDSNGRENLIHEYAYPEYRTYDSRTATGKVFLYDDPKGLNPVHGDNTVYVPSVGNVLKTDPKLVKDPIFKDSYVFNHPDYIKYFLKYYNDIDKEGNLVLTGYTNGKRNMYDISKGSPPRVFISDNEKFGFISMTLLKNPIFNYFYKEDLSCGVFYPKNWAIPKSRMNKVLYRKCKSPVGRFEDSIANKPATYVYTFGKKYRFGLEIETSSGYLPEYLDYDLFYSAVHDGSLRDPETEELYGGEYVTDILWGDQGLKQTKSLCYELTKRCMINKRCGVHVHLSGINFNKENIVLMYYLYQKLQDEIYSLLPPSRRDNEYCRKLDHIDISLKGIRSTRSRELSLNTHYAEIMKFLSSQSASGPSVNKKKDHPKGFKCNYDHSTARYCWVNFVPAVFNTRNNGVYTLEFRPMSASTSYTKIKNWLLLCFALVDIVENHKQFIYDTPNITLVDVVKQSYGDKAGSILDFISNRKEKFMKDATAEEKEYSEKELNSNMSIKSL